MRQMHQWRISYLDLEKNAPFGAFKEEPSWTP